MSQSDIEQDPDAGGDPRRDGRRRRARRTTAEHVDEVEAADEVADRSRRRRAGRRRGRRPTTPSRRSPTTTPSRSRRRADAAEADVDDGRAPTPTRPTSADEADEDDPLEAFRRELWAKPGEWYVVHTYSGMENRVQSNLENRIVSLNMEDYIYEIVVPTEEVAEIKNGQRKMVKRTVLPGYVLVRMDLTDESWAAVRHTPSVHRLRRPRPPAGAAEHERGREHARPGRDRPRRGPGRLRRRGRLGHDRRQEAGRGRRLRRVATR